MYGSISGDLLGIAFFLEFQALGFVLASIILRKHGTLYRLFIGSTLGSFLFSWIPFLFSAIT